MFDSLRRGGISSQVEQKRPLRRQREDHYFASHLRPVPSCFDMDSD
jgi:hypothetical protein